MTDPAKGRSSFQSYVFTPVPSARPKKRQRPPGLLKKIRAKKTTIEEAIKSKYPYLNISNDDFVQQQIHSKISQQQIDEGKKQRFESFINLFDDQEKELFSPLCSTITTPQNGLSNPASSRRSRGPPSLPLKMYKLDFSKLKEQNGLRVQSANGRLQQDDFESLFGSNTARALAEHAEEVKKEKMALLKQNLVSAANPFNARDISNIRRMSIKKCQSKDEIPKICINVSMLGGTKLHPVHSVRGSSGSESSSEPCSQAGVRNDSIDKDSPELPVKEGLKHSNSIRITVVQEPGTAENKSIGKRKLDSTTMHKAPLLHMNHQFSRSKTNLFKKEKKKGLDGSHGTSGSRSGADSKCFEFVSKQLDNIGNMSSSSSGNGDNNSLDQELLGDQSSHSKGGGLGKLDFAHQDTLGVDMLSLPLHKSNSTRANQRGKRKSDNINDDLGSSLSFKQAPRWKDESSLFPFKKMRTVCERKSEAVSTNSVRTQKDRKKKLIKINQYKIIKTLGAGSFATVKLVKDTENNELYAMKQMNKEYLKKQKMGKTNAYESVLAELRVLQKLEHPNIIFLREIIDDPSKDFIYIITQYHTNGSLGDILEEKNKKYEFHNKKCLEEGREKECHYVGLRASEVRLYFIDMLKAIHYCHNVVKVIHRDIKPDNIVMNHNNEAVLIDFGVSAQMDDLKSKPQQNMGTYFFFSPEMLETRKNDKGEPIRSNGEANDIWALGITFFKLLTGRYPFRETKSVIKLKELILQGGFDFELVKNKDARQIIKSMLELDPAKRATLGDLVKCDWVTKHGAEPLNVEQLSDGLSAASGKNSATGFGNLNRVRTASICRGKTNIQWIRGKSLLDINSIKGSDFSRQSKRASQGGQPSVF